MKPQNRFVNLKKTIKPSHAHEDYASTYEDEILNSFNRLIDLIDILSNRFIDWIKRIWIGDKISLGV